MKHSTIIRLKQVAETGTNEESFEAINTLRKLNPTYHYCPDWDFMVICNKDPEISGCTCSLTKKS